MAITGAVRAPAPVAPGSATDLTNRRAARSRWRTACGWVFAGDRRVWRAAAVVGLPLVALVAVWCLVPRAYLTGTDNVAVQTYVAPTPANQPLCVYDLDIPAGTARLRLRLISRTQQRPPLHMRLIIGGAVMNSSLPAQRVGTSRISDAVFPIPPRPARPTTTPASLCLTAPGLVNWGGTPTTTGMDRAPTLNGASVTARVAVFYLPRAGAQRSYLAGAADVFRRAALFRPGLVGPWLYPVLLFGVLPLLALAALRCLAQAAAGRGRRLAVWVFAICALNGACWALITPVFQGPDEVDHFAYVQSLAERGQPPDTSASPRPRWSGSEALAINATKMLTDHTAGDGRVPWLSLDQRRWQAARARAHPRADDGGGLETAATHGPLYYGALVPAYAAASASPFDQLTLTRLASALIGALTALFTYLLGRELAPRRPWLAVLAALLVSFEPMYGFISGVVNNDVGVDAGAAAVELLLIRMVRRGLTWPSGLLTGALLMLLPVIKGTGYSLFPVAALAAVAALWRHHRRADLPGWVALAFAAAGALFAWSRISASLHHSTFTTVGGGSPVRSSQALSNIPGYLSYLWQVFLPRLPFMAPHFQGQAYPAFVIFVERGFGAFGWYDVLWAPWVYSVILAAMLITPLLALAAARREWAWVRAHWIECALIVLMPVAVIAGFEAAFYDGIARPAIAEFGRYAFPAIGPLALLVVGALHALGRRRVVAAGAALAVAMIVLSYAGQLVTLTGFYA